MKTQIRLAAGKVTIDNINFHSRSLASIIRIDQREELNITRWCHQDGTDSAFLQLHCDDKRIYAVGYSEDRDLSNYNSLLAVFDHQLNLLDLRIYAALPLSYFNQIEMTSDHHLICRGECCNPRFKEYQHGNATTFIFDQHLNLLSRCISV